MTSEVTESARAVVSSEAEQARVLSPSANPDLDEPMFWSQVQLVSAVFLGWCLLCPPQELCPSQGILLPCPASPSPSAFSGPLCCCPGWAGWGWLWTALPAQLTSFPAGDPQREGHFPQGPWRQLTESPSPGVVTGTGDGVLCCPTVWPRSQCCPKPGPVGGSAPRSGCQVSHLSPAARGFVGPGGGGAKEQGQAGTLCWAGRDRSCGVPAWPLADCVPLGGRPWARSPYSVSVWLLSVTVAKRPSFVDPWLV